MSASRELPVRLLPFWHTDGPTQMAADEMMLEAALEGVASLRFYTWTEATLSLGYFQSHAECMTDPRLAGLPYVRRATGGGAIVHHHELTYSFALPADSKWHPPGEPWTCRVHYQIIDVFAEMELSARANPCGAEQGAGEFLCFLHQTPGDVLMDQSKIVGSAQRKRTGALMQHGSILLAQSEHTPQLPGIYEPTGRGMDAVDLSIRLTDAFEAAFGWTITPVPFTDREKTRVEQLAQDRYRTAEWNDRR